MASDLNQVMVVGNLVRDMELKYTSGGMPIGSFSIANNRPKKTDGQWSEEANFFDVTVFGKVSEALQQYLVKGKKVGVSGELKQDRWQNQEGQNRSKVQIIARDIQLLGGREQGTTPPQAPETQAPAPAAPSPSDGFDDDIPF